MMLFHTSKDGQVLLHKDVYKICPEFKILSEEEVRYIVLAYDYYSPFNQLELLDRKNMAIKLTEISNANSKKIQVAIELYRSLQYDTKRERIKLYRNKIGILDSQMNDPEISPNKITQIINSQDILENKIKELETDIEFSLFSGELKGGRVKSLLEWMKENRKLYEMEVENKNDISIKIAYDIPSLDE